MFEYIKQPDGKFKKVVKKEYEGYMKYIERVKEGKEKFYGTKTERLALFSMRMIHE